MKHKYIFRSCQNCHELINHQRKLSLCNDCLGQMLLDYLDEGANKQHETAEREALYHSRPRAQKYAGVY